MHLVLHNGIIASIWRISEIMDYCLWILNYNLSLAIYPNHWVIFDPKFKIFKVNPKRKTEDMAHVISIFSKTFCRWEFNPS